MNKNAELELLESLDILLERQLICQGARTTWLNFSHHQIQQVLYENLTTLKRRPLHHEAGEALERRHAVNPKTVVEELAHHFIQAGAIEKGVIYSLEAARLAESVYAQQNALVRYTQALDALEQLGPTPDTQRQKFQLLLARPSR